VKTPFQGHGVLGQQIEKFDTNAFSRHVDNPAFYLDRIVLIGNRNSKFELFSRLELRGNFRFNK